MHSNRLIRRVLGAAVALVACAGPTDNQQAQRSSQPSSINSCDDGVEACEGNTRCESCLIEGECASGPNPVWTGTECVCTDDEPANCVYEFCCALEFEWDPVACACLPCVGDDDDDDDDDDQGEDEH